MAATRTATESNFKTLPKLGPKSVIYRRRSNVEEQEQQLKIREAVNAYVSRVFGEGPTESEKLFLAALNETGEFSLGLIVIFIFLIWYMVAVELGSTILSEEAFVVRCKIPELEMCLSFSEVLNISVLNKTPTHQDCRSKQYCSYDDRDYSQLVAAYSCNYQAMLNAIKLDPKIPNTKPCVDYVTIRENVSTIIVKDNIPTYISLRQHLKFFCDKDNWRAFGLAKAYGTALSALMLAPTTDLFGRKRMFMITSLVHLLSCILLFLPWNWCIIMGFFLSGFGRCAIISLYVLCLEICSNVMILWLGLLVILMPPIVKLVEFLLHCNINIWLYLHLATTSMLFVLPFGIWYITESPRWLMFTGNEAAAWNTLKKLESSAVTNDSNVHESVPIKIPSLKNILGFFNKPLFRERITSCIILHFLTSISFYILEDEYKHMHLGTEEFYLILSGFQVLIAIAGYFSAIRFGRKRTCFIFYCLLTVLDGLIFMENQYFDHQQILPVMLYFREALKAGITFVLLFYTSEMFPTPYRVTAVYLCVVSAFLAVVIQQHFYHMFHPEPKAIRYMPPFTTSITSALIVSFLPKTKNVGLPDTPRDALLFKVD